MQCYFTQDSERTREILPPTKLWVMQVGLFFRFFNTELSGNRLRAPSSYSLSIPILRGLINEGVECGWVGRHASISPSAPSAAG